MTAAPLVHAFFHEPTFTVTYLAVDPATRQAALIDPVLDYDHKSGRTHTRSIDAVLAKAAADRLDIAWIIDTHVHADHLSAAQHARSATGAPVVIGAHVPEVQRTFRPIFDAADMAADGSQFDRLVGDGESLKLGELEIRGMHTPGHTPACMTYVIGDAAFVGDTLFMPDYGTARCDFPGGDARVLYRSIRRILALPAATRIFTCHDYKAPGRTHFAWESSVAEQRAGNIHIHEGVGEDAFAAMRKARDATLEMPVLILPSVQVNMRAGNFPPAGSDGHVYLRVPVNRL